MTTPLCCLSCGTIANTERQLLAHVATTRFPPVRCAMMNSISAIHFARFISLVVAIISSNIRGAFAADYVRTAGTNCGTGGAQTIEPGDGIKCCSNTRVKGYDFTLTTSGTFKYSSYVMKSASSNTWMAGSDCNVDASGQACTGGACHAAGSYLNDCKANDCCWGSSLQDYWCMHVKCEEYAGVFGLWRGDDCVFDKWSLSFDRVSTYSPTPTPTPTPYPSSWIPTQAPTPPITVRVPTPSYTVETTKKSAKGLRAGLGIGLSFGGGILMWCLRGCRGKNIDATDTGAPETSTTGATSMPPLQRESPMV